MWNLIKTYELKVMTKSRNAFHGDPRLDGDIER